MSSPVYIAVICEGRTELVFAQSILAPHLALRNVFLTASQITKPGQDGGDVKYQRLITDLKNFLNQSQLSLVTTFFDFYGLKGEWPGYVDALKKATPAQKHRAIGSAVKAELDTRFSELDSVRRFLPYFSMHEIEALYFSDPAVMAKILGVRQTEIDQIISSCSEPEAINHDRDTSPSHRIGSLIGKEFKKKTTTGIAIAKEIGLHEMRSSCPVFDEWLNKLEKLASS